MAKFSDHKVCINKGEELRLARGNGKSKTSILILLEYLKNKYPEDKETIEYFMQLAKEM